LGKKSRANRLRERVRAVLSAQKSFLAVTHLNHFPPGWMLANAGSAKRRLFQSQLRLTGLKTVKGREACDHFQSGIFAQSS
jgi:hypothetical protein